MIRKANVLMVVFFWVCVDEVGVRLCRACAVRGGKGRDLSTHQRWGEQPVCVPVLSWRTRGREIFCGNRSIDVHQTARNGVAPHTTARSLLAGVIAGVCPQGVSVALDVVFCCYLSQISSLPCSSRD